MASEAGPSTGGGPRVHALGVGRGRYVSDERYTNIGGFIPQPLSDTLVLRATGGRTGPVGQLASIENAVAHVTSIIPQFVSRRPYLKSQQLVSNIKQAATWIELALVDSHRRHIDTDLLCTQRESENYTRHMTMATRDLHAVGLVANLICELYPRVVCAPTNLLAKIRLQAFETSNYFTQRAADIVRDDWYYHYDASEVRGNYLQLVSDLDVLIATVDTLIMHGAPIHGGQAYAAEAAYDESLPSLQM
jgi:hypothetical protein